MPESAESSAHSAQLRVEAAEAAVDHDLAILGLDRAGPAPVHGLARRNTAARRQIINPGVVDLLRGRIAELEAALGNTSLRLHSANLRLYAIEQSTCWLATAVLRSVLRHLPARHRLAVRCILRAGWWLVTPHRTGERVKFFRERRRIAIAHRATGMGQECANGRAVGGEQIEGLANAFESLRLEVRVRPGDLKLREEFGNTAERFFVREWNRAVEIARQGRWAAAQELMGQACERLGAALATAERLPLRVIRSVAIFGIHSVPQCLLYRIEQKADHLRAAGYEVGVYDSDTQIKEFLAEIYKYDAAIFYRIPSTPIYISIINKAKEIGLTTFYDIDDMIFNGEFYPPSFESFRGLIGLNEYISITISTPVYRYAISLCDFAIASTRPLARQLEKVVGAGNVFIHRNGLGQRHARVAPRVPLACSDEVVTIFYGSGTTAHKEDFQDLVEPALAEIVGRYGERVKIVLIGYIAPSERLEAIKDNITFVERVLDVEEYWSLLQSADINLAVLKPTMMADCKSEIKWLEAAMFAVPSVVSGTETYRETVEDGVTGLICDTVEEWTYALDILIRDARLRRRIGLAAWRRVCTRYSIDRMGENLAEIFDEVTRASAAPRKPVVLIVNVFYPPQAIGGATRVVHDNATQLASLYKDDFQIEVFTSAIGEEDCRLFCYAQDGARVTALTRLQLPEFEVAINDHRVGLIFGEVLDHLQPSLVHFHCIQRLSPSVVTAALKREIPYVITVHDGYWISDFQFIVDENNTPCLYDYADPLSVMAKRGKSAYERMMQLRTPLFGAAKTLAVSEKFAELHRQCGVPNVVTIANGISDLLPVTRTPSADRRVNLALIGGANRYKGFDLIKSAVSSTKFSQLRLTVIDYDMKPGERRVEVWNTTEVEFLPKVAEERVTELYAKVDVLLAPSVWPESFGLVSREALQCGCWVIASDRGSVGECVTEGVNGHIVDVGDTGDLIRVLSEIDQDPVRYRVSPPPLTKLRRARDQVDDLAGLYRSLIQSAEQDAWVDILPRKPVGIAANGSLTGPFG
jgi:glycosyltransferase involved in cell wall biosynthesis